MKSFRNIINLHIRVILIYALCAFNLAFIPAVAGKVKQGNALYEKENYDEALKKYTDAQIDKPESPELFFNIADVLYKQRKYNEAEQMFEKAIPQSEPALESKIYYNIGNCKYKQGNLRESIDYYKKALELNPQDEDAKYNIEFVEKKIKEMMSQSKERQEKQQQKQQEQKEKNKPEQKQGGGEQPKEKTQQETQASAGEQNKEQKEKAEQESTQQAETQNEQQMGEQPQALKKDEAESLLRMMADEERNNPKPEDERRKRTRYPEMEKPW